MPERRKIMDETGKTHCAWCGGLLTRKLLQGEYRLFCETCGRISYENPITGVAGIILSPKGEILLGKRAKGETSAGWWCIPCGHVEYNEDIRQALVREMREETGFWIMPVAVYAVYSNFHEKTAHSTGIWFLTRVCGGFCRGGDDVAEAAFFSASQLPPLAFETDALVLEQLKRENMLKG